MPEYKYRKDCSPEKTVSNIRRILCNVGIEVREFPVVSPGESLHSIRIELMDLPGSGCNGKGTTEQRALASAYAELMERLQNRFMVGFQSRYGIMPDITKPADPPDQLRIPIQHFLKKSPEFLESFFEPPLSADSFPQNCEVLCLPYLELAENRTVYLPQSLQTGDHRWSLLTNRIGSTGMCAGNSFSEAVCQGLCEILERFVMRDAFIGTPNLFPTIPIESLKNRSIYPLIEQIRAKKLYVLVKDCSLGGRFPVVGTIILDHENRGMIRFGADPSFDTALERCLTESFQGTTDTMYTKQRIPIDLSEDSFSGPPFYDQRKNCLRHFILGMKNGSSKIPPNFLLSGIAHDPPGSFTDNAETNKEALDFVVERILTSGCRIFVRDVSFLGFPSYHVFVGGMSDALLPRFTQDNVKDQFERINRWSDLNCTLRLSSATEKEIRACAEVIEAEWLASQEDPLQYDMIRNTPMLSWAGGLVLAPWYDGASLEQGDFLLAMLFLRLGDHKKASEYLDGNLKRTGCAPENNGYFLGAKAYCRMKAQGLSKSNIQAVLNDLLGREKALEIIDDFSDRRSTFRSLQLPECGDCSICPISDSCLYEGWRRMQSTLRKHLESVKLDQGPRMANS